MYCYCHNPILVFIFGWLVFPVSNMIHYELISLPAMSFDGARGTTECAFTFSFEVNKLLAGGHANGKYMLGCLPYKHFIIPCCVAFFKL
jgi:hypothetical protein